MPEGDAVWRAARRLDGALRGAPLIGVDLRWPRLPDLALIGSVTVEVVPRGKHILHRLDSGVTIHSHLRMDGSWRTRPTASVTPSVAQAHDIRAILATQRTAAIGRLLGMLDVVATADEQRLVGHLGPDLLGRDWDAQRAIANLRAQPDRGIAAALLDQRNLAGLGTMWAAESLHAAGVAPTGALRDVADDRLLDVVDHGHRLLHKAITGRAPTDLRVYRLAGRACQRCGSTITAATVGEAPEQRTIFYCPGCQAA